MGAPTLTARGTPAGIRLDDGFSTLIAFAANPTVSLWEKTVTPPGVDGGDSIDTFTMHAVTWRQKAARQLKTLTDGKFMAAYDPDAYEQLVALVNVETSITVHFPDGSTYTFFGYLQKFEPADLEEGKQPEATCTFVCTNTDPSDGTEAGPVMVNVAGT